MMGFRFFESVRVETDPYPSWALRLVIERRTSWLRGRFVRRQELSIDLPLDVAVRVADDLQRAASLGYAGRGGA